MLEALVEFDVRFQHHPLELEQRGGLLGVVVRLELPLWALGKFEHPHLLLMQPSDGCGGRRTLSNRYKWCCSVRLTGTSSCATSTVS